MREEIEFIAQHAAQFEGLSVVKADRIIDIARTLLSERDQLRAENERLRKVVGAAKEAELAIAQLIDEMDGGGDAEDQKARVRLRKKSLRFYGKQLGIVLAALDQEEGAILPSAELVALRAENERLTSLLASANRADETAIAQQNERLRQCIGLFSTAKPDMRMDAENPENMAHEVVAYCERLRKLLAEGVEIIKRLDGARTHTMDFAAVCPEEEFCNRALAALDKEEGA